MVPSPARPGRSPEMGAMTPDLTIALMQRASSLLRTGPLDAAIQAHKQLLDLRPDLPDSWYNLGWLQRSARHYLDALHSYQQALRHRIRGPEEVHVNRSVILGEHLGRQDEAAAELHAALAVNPAYIPALLNLALHHEDKGEADAARTLYERILAIDPIHARALARRSALAADSSAILGLRAALAKPCASAADQAELGFALGQALDAVGAHDEAFAAFVDANLASRLSAAPPGVRYDRAAQELFVERMIRAFPAPVSAGSADAGDPPIFICGPFRSGSTLVERILARHSRVTAGGELEMLPALIGERLPAYPKAPPDPDSIRQIRQAYLGELKAIHPVVDRVTDKRCDNVLHIGLIKALFPNARIVHTVRDPRDTALSVYFHHFQHNLPYALDLADIAHWLGQYARLMRHWKALYPDDIHDLRYEALVADPRPVLERLLGHCTLDWEEACLSFHEGKGVVKTASAWQVRKALYTSSAGRWRNYRDHLARSAPDLAAMAEDVDVASLGRLS